MPCFVKINTCYITNFTHYKTQLWFATLKLNQQDSPCIDILLTSTSHCVLILKQCAFSVLLYSLHLLIFTISNGFKSWQTGACLCYARPTESLHQGKPYTRKVLRSLLSVILHSSVNIVVLSRTDGARCRCRGNCAASRWSGDRWMQNCS